MKQKTKQLIMTLALLLTAVTGAWAQETPLLTIESKDYTSFKSGSKTFDDKVTITFSDEVYNEGDDWGWYAEGTASLLTVAGTNGYTITSCKFYTDNGVAATGYTVQGESPSVYLYHGNVYTDANRSVNIGSNGITKIEVYGTAPAATSGPEVAWTAATKTGTFTMPGGNVTLEPEYYPQAALTAAPTAADGAKATTDDLLVSGGTVATITGSDPAAPQGTLMYYVSTSTMTTEALLALDADKWVTEPTAAGITQKCGAFVYYYVKGNDSTDDALNFSDGDISSDNVLNVPIYPAPLWNAEFDLTNAPEADKADGIWKTDITGDGVVKGTTVTVTYSGTKKVIGVKAEKKAKAPSLSITSPAVGQVIGSDGKNYAYGSLPTGVTAVAKICYVSGSNGLALALTDEGYMEWSTAIETCAAHTPAFTGGTWKLASQDEWNNMITAAGHYSALRDGFSSVGGTNMQSNYWSSTESNAEGAWYYYFDYGGWADAYKDSEGNAARACLAF